MGEEGAAPVILYRNLQSKPFIPSDDPMTTGKEWEVWLEGIEREFRFFGITKDQDKVDALIIYEGTEIARLEKSLPNQEGDRNKYTKLKTKLNDYFLPKKNKHYARYKFLSTKPQQNEPILSYATRLREKARTCKFTNTEERLLEHLIQTVANKTLVQKAVNKKWELTQFLEEAAQMEDIQQQMSDMMPHIAKVGSAPTRPHHRKYTDEKKQKQHAKYATCNYCGFNTHPPGKIAQHTAKNAGLVRRRTTSLKCAVAGRIQGNQTDTLANQVDRVGRSKRHMRLAMVAQVTRKWTRLSNTYKSIR